MTDQPAQDSSSPPPPLDIPQLLAWARQAGQIALRHFQKVVPQRKPDDTFLTQADLEIEHFLSEQIRTTYPNDGLIGEEGAKAPQNAYAASVWAIDPLDGTTAFVQGLPGWGISIGLLHQGQPAFGLFYMPLLDDMTYTANQDEVYNNDRDLRGAIRADWEEKGFLAINSSAHRRFQLDVPRIRTMGSIGANLIYMSRGVASGAFIPKAHIWDLVAGAAIVRRAGGTLRYLSGHPIDYRPLLNGDLAPEPIIAGHPKLLTELQQAIRPRSSASSSSG